MTGEYEFLVNLFRTFLFIAAVCTTLVPVVFAFSEWNQSPLGRVFMLQAVAFAAAVDTVALFRFWRPDGTNTVITVYAIMFGLISVGTASVAWQIVKINYTGEKKP